jgi:hypothetical protein
MQILSYSFPKYNPYYVVTRIAHYLERFIPIEWLHDGDRCDTPLSPLWASLHA